MIIQGKPELGLQKHQQDAYQSVQEAYETKNKASVVIPTGCGKSFIALQLMVDNKDKRILFMAPSNAIKNQMYNYIAKYIVGEEPSKERPAKMIADEYFPNLKIMLYPSLLRVTDEQMDNLDADIIIMDELHRTGADKWGERINTLLDKNPNAKILGLTATPDRMDDKNVIDSLFEGSIDYELTLVEALRRRIVEAPTYVKCDYALGEYLDGIRTAIANCSDEQTKKELQDKYDKMRRIVEQADGIPELFAKNIKKKDGKYIIFCRDKEHMDELMSKAKEWFGAIDSEPEIYSVFSGEGYSEKSNKDTIEAFENSKSDHTKLLFSIEMLNEGVHIEDISGAIMARPTDSKIIYLQQLGRVLSSDTSREKTIVFDLVNNYLKNNLDAEINKNMGTEAKNIEGGHTNNSGGDVGSWIKDIDNFRIQGETKEFLELLNEVQGIIDRSSYLTNARAIKEWIKKSGETKPPSQKAKDEEEGRLGRALSNIRQGLIKPYMRLETEEEREKYREDHPEIDEVLEIINEIDENNFSPYLRNARTIKKWIDASGETKPPSSIAKDEEERRLGNALVRIRHGLIKPYMRLETEEEREKYREDYPELDEVLEIINKIDENKPTHLQNARAIKKWIDASGGTKPPTKDAKDEEERMLGKALSNIRQGLIKPYMSKKTEEERKQFRKDYPEIDEILEIINEIDENKPTHLRNARAIKEWIDASGETKPPAASSKDEEERRLGQALGSIRQRLINPYMRLETEEKREQFRKKHPELDEVLVIINEIDEKNIPTYLQNARAIKEWIDASGETKLPSQKAKDEEEGRLGRALSNIRKLLIKPYMILETEEEREKYRKDHPETDEVLDIISELDMQSGTKKGQELAILIRQDLEKRKALEEAKKLKQAYEQQLSIKKGESPKETQKQGVDYDE